MPPKPKFNREEIIFAGLEIAREEGIAAVKAREVGEKLGCSSRPIFTFFDSMEDLQKAVENKAWEVYYHYLEVADNYIPAFKMRGMQMIKFAQEEPKLFQLLFMTEKESVDLKQLIKNKANGFASDLQDISKSFDLTYEETTVLFDNVWVFGYGICALCATKVCALSDDEIASMLGRSFASAMMLVKSKKVNEFDFRPEKKNSVEVNVHSKAFIRETAEA